MRHTDSRPEGRSAFTLVEILVVISIISVLAALAVVGVMGAFGQGTLATTKVEIDQMAAALNLVKTTYQVKYLPSRIVLREDGNYNNPNDPLYPEHQRTVKFLSQMFPKIDLTKPIDWNGDNMIATTTNPLNSDGKGNYILYADQTLVFFLGGIPSRPTEPNGCRGFATAPNNPGSAADLDAGNKTGPFFDFVPARLERMPNGFFRYVDQWKNKPTMPYLYFSTNGSDNSYHYLNNPQDLKFPMGDCPPNPAAAGLNQIVSPYYEAPPPSLLLPPRFTNPSSFQIICAGKDGLFGKGGLWDPTKGYLQNDPGADDQASFSGNILGKAR
jgi:prepilin-type N-terminal cleavage/methylation domain-containing protein